MTDSRKNKLVATNAAVLAAAGLVSFVLPMIATSITEGRGNFLIAMAQIAPILCVIPISCSLVGKSHAESDASAT